jgi:hypothetical protein
LASSNAPAAATTNLPDSLYSHRRARSDDHRRDAAWFGKEAQIKQRAWDEAMKLVV